MYIAEQKAREDTELRNKIANQHFLREKEMKDAELRALAMQARIKKNDFSKFGVSSSHPTTQKSIDISSHPKASSSVIGCKNSDQKPSSESTYFGRYHTERHRETSKERRHRIERDEVREERCRTRERERRLADADLKNGQKHFKLTRDHDRDISERIALGMNRESKLSLETMYDQRLFNHEPGLQSGFGEEYNYNLFDKPLFSERKT